MGLGDEIMALGEADALYEQTGQPVSIVNELGSPRFSPIWINSPSISPTAAVKLNNSAGNRPYIKHWKHRQAVFNVNYRPRAGKICLTEQEKAFYRPEKPYIVVAPSVKKNASANKNWGESRWEKTLTLLQEGLKEPIHVVQLLADQRETPIKGAMGIPTPDVRLAAAVISGAKLVLCNEGGNHHMAASFGVPAVVIFGSFIPPEVTGYKIHANICVETEHGYCGKFDPCHICQKSLSKITPELVASLAIGFLGGTHGSGVYRV